MLFLPYLHYIVYALIRGDITEYDIIFVSYVSVMLSSVNHMHLTYISPLFVAKMDSKGERTNTTRQQMEDR